MRKSFLARLAAWAIKTTLVVMLATIVWVTAYRWIDPPVTSLMVRDRVAGTVLRHDWRAIEDMSPRIAYAVIAAEDQNFCVHNGFDFKAISKAMKSNRNGGKLRGASTISQQVAKNLFLWPQRSWVRKGLESWFTLLIEVIWPKQRILEVYLNVAEWGDGVYGVEAASRHHFGRSASGLSRTQAARLAAVLPSPIKWSPHSWGGVARKARSIERAMPFIKREMSGCLELP